MTTREKIDREARLKAMRQFVTGCIEQGDVGLHSLAAFIVNLAESVDGLGENNTALAEKYRQAIERADALAALGTGEEVPSGVCDAIRFAISVFDKQLGDRDIEHAEDTRPEFVACQRLACALLKLQAPPAPAAMEEGTLVRAGDLHVGDRFLAHDALWAVTDFDCGTPIARKITVTTHGQNESICHFEEDRLVQFVPPTLSSPARNVEEADDEPMCKNFRHSPDCNCGSQDENYPI